VTTGSSPIDLRVFPGGPFEENSWLVWDPVTGEGVAVDPGGGAEELLAAAAPGSLLPQGIRIHSILLTHAHLDHIDGVGIVHAATGAPIHLHPAAIPQYRSLPQQGAAFGFRLEPTPPHHGLLQGGDRFQLGAIDFEVVDAPGHAPGHVIFHQRDAGVALVGDVIFAGSVGRTDLPGGDHATLLRSIRDAILPLPPETRLLPGHGPETTVAREWRSNPFLGPLRPGAPA